MPLTNPKPKIKNLISLRTQRLAESFEGMSSSLAHSAKELWTCQDTCKQLDFAGTIWFRLLQEC